MAQNQGFTVWLTGMSCTGKSTLAQYVAARLRQVDRNVEVLDENTLIDEFWAQHEESKEDRSSLVRRLGLLANMLSRNNVAALVASVSPYKATREENRRLIGRYVEVYVDCPTEKLIQRDSSGKYKKALTGEIPNFIGITEPYEPPYSPEVTIHSDEESIEEGGRKIFQALLDLGYVRNDELKTITGKPVRPKVSTQAAARPSKSSRKSRPAKGSRKARPAARAARVAKASKKASGRKKSK